MAETALFDSVVVEPDLTPQKIAELLGRGRESAKLDYKLTYDPSDTTARVELAKDVMAMSNTAGGYLVIGVSDDRTAEGLTEAAAGSIDEATIRAQVAGYTSARIPIFVDNGVVHEKVRFAVITVLPVRSTLVVVETVGNRRDGRAVFRPGDVLVRHGSASERWNQADVDFLLRRVVEHRKEEWLRDFGDDLRKLIGTATPPSLGVVTEAAYESSPEDFQELVLSLLRRVNG